MIARRTSDFERDVLCPGLSHKNNLINGWTNCHWRTTHRGEPAKKKSAHLLAKGGIVIGDYRLGAP